MVPLTKHLFLMNQAGFSVLVKDLREENRLVVHEDNIVIDMNTVNEGVRPCGRMMGCDWGGRT